MSIKNSTKQAFANALKSLLGTKELSAVRVQELCRLCGTERPTFYYHFRDKYDLIAWIYEQDFQESVRNAGGRYDVAQMENLLIRMGKEQNFYKKAFADATQNALLPFILQSNIRLARSLFQGGRAGDELTREEEFRIRIYTHVWCGGLKDWINGETDFTAEEYAALLYRSIAALDKEWHGRENPWDILQ